MSDPLLATPGAQGEGQNAPDLQPTDAAGGVQPGAQDLGQQGGGPLAPDVHPAVVEERQRASRYRQQLEQLVELDPQGQIVGLRPEIVDAILQQAGGQPAPAAPAAPPGGDDAYRHQVEAWAERLGFLPQQVEGIITLAQAIGEQMADRATEPVLNASLETVKATLIASGDVPPEAASYVARWVDTAKRLNPRALMTQQGRETVLRQALGEYYLQQSRGGRPRGAGAGVTPSLLRPAAGPATPTPTAEEMALRQKLGLPTGYTKHSPTGAV